MEKELFCLISRILPKVKHDKVTAVVEHLLSDDVGVSSLEDLVDVEETYLSSLLPPIPRSQLVKAFKKLGTKTGEGIDDLAGPSHRKERDTVLPERPLQELSVGNRYRYKINWNAMPKPLIDELETAHDNNQAAPRQLKALKLAIAIKVMSDYQSWRERNPGIQKTPGVAIYKDITNQVYEKFGKAMQIVVNGKVLSDGKTHFQHVFHVCIENRYRAKTTNVTPITAKQGKGTIGVLIAEYRPPLSEADTACQSELRAKLKKLFLIDERQWQWEEITTDMDRCFSLQRFDIGQAKNVVIEAQEHTGSNTSNADDEMADDPIIPALQEVQNQWPFLTTPPCLSSHHNRLTGRNIREAMLKFCEDYLKVTLLFMTSGSKSNTKNLALRIRIEGKCENISDSSSLLMLTQMVAHHFEEDWSVLLLSAERTTLPAELELQSTEGCVCIVGLDEEPVLAQKYVVCADNLPLVKAADGAAALTALIELCFVFDFNYPALPRTMEFLERFVFGMGFSDSRVTNKHGKQLYTLTDGVNKLINNIQDFSKELIESSTSQQQTVAPTKRMRLQ